MFQGEETPDDGRGFDGAHMLATALASVVPPEESGPPAPATLAAQRHLEVWRERVGAPESELHRAGRRLTAVIGKLEPERVRAALTGGDQQKMARAFVEECGRWDRDFVWDVPLRDTARAIIAAAALAVSEEIESAAEPDLEPSEPESSIPEPSNPAPSAPARLEAPRTLASERVLRPTEDAPGDISDDREGAGEGMV